MQEDKAESTTRAARIEIDDLHAQLVSGAGHISTVDHIRILCSRFWSDCTEAQQKALLGLEKACGSPVLQELLESASLASGDVFHIMETGINSWAWYRMRGEEFLGKSNGVYLTRDECFESMLCNGYQSWHALKETRIEEGD